MSLTDHFSYTYILKTLLKTVKYCSPLNLANMKIQKLEFVRYIYRTG